MHIDINPKKELFIWGPIEFKLIYGSAFINTILLRVTDHYPWPWPPALCLFKEGKIFFIMDYKKLRETGSKYFKKYFLNEDNCQKLWGRWENWIKEYELFARKTEKIKWRELSDKEIYRRIKNFYKLNIDFWLIVHAPEIANWGGEHLLKNKLQKIYPKNFEDYLEILSAPIKPSFFQEEELELLKTALIKKNNEKEKAIENHAKKYCWLLNSYGGNRILKTAYFKNKLEELTKQGKAGTLIKRIKKNLKNNLNRKQALIEKTSFSNKIIAISEKLAESIWWQDLRKGYIWRLNYWLDIFLKEISKRHEWDFQELIWCHMEELEDICRGKKLNKLRIAARKKYYLYYAGKNSKIKTANAAKVTALEKKYLDTGDKSEIKKITGLTVSKGKTKKIRGKVRIIYNPFTAGKKFKDGEILVTGMTSPEFVILMRKAKAIITDQGSMVCHAAIVSREFKIPCIVKTKIATKILRDGDFVEVDVTKGVVKKISAKG